METDVMKTCTGCKHVLPKNVFYKSSTTKDGWSFQCIRCESNRKKEARKKDPELVKKHRERNKQWYNDNKEKKRNKNKEWIQNNPAKFRNSNLKARFGIDLEEYTRILDSQDRKCSICGIDYDSLDYELSVDHCHTTGNIRGLLCKQCNSGLGFFKDNEEFLHKAIEYLKNHRK